MEVSDVDVNKYTCCSKICKNINASLLYTVKERIVYKEMFRYGLTIFDIIKFNYDI